MVQTRRWYTSFSIVRTKHQKAYDNSEKKEEIVISAEVWNGVTSTKLRWKQWMEERKNNPDFPSGTAQCIGLVLEDGRPLRARTEELKEKFGVLFKIRHI